MIKKHAWVLLCFYTIFLVVVMYFGVLKYAVLLFELPEEVVIKAIGFSGIVELLSHIATVGVFALSIYMWRDSKRESKKFMALSMIDKTKVILEGKKSYCVEEYNIYRQLVRTNTHISMLEEPVRADFVMDLEVVLRTYLERLSSLDFFKTNEVKNPIKFDLNKIQIDVNNDVLRGAILLLARDVYQYGVYGKTITNDKDSLFWISAQYSANTRILTQLILQAHPILRGSSYLEKDGRQWKQNQIEKLHLDGGLVPPVVVAFLYLCLSGKIHPILRQFEEFNK